MMQQGATDSPPVPPQMAEILSRRSSSDSMSPNPMQSLQQQAAMGPPTSHQQVTGQPSLQRQSSLGEPITGPSHSVSRPAVSMGPGIPHQNPLGHPQGMMQTSHFGIQPQGFPQRLGHQGPVAESNVVKQPTQQAQSQQQSSHQVCWSKC